MGLNSTSRSRHEVRENGQAGKSRRGKSVGDDYGCPVADSVDKSCGEEIDGELNHKVHGDEQGDSAHGNAVCTLKRQKQKRHKIVYDCLHYVSRIAGGYGLCIRFFFG